MQMNNLVCRAKAAIAESIADAQCIYSQQLHVDQFHFMLRVSVYLICCYSLCIYCYTKKRFLRRTKMNDGLGNVYFTMITILALCIDKFPYLLSAFDFYSKKFINLLDEIDDCLYC